MKDTERQAINNLNNILQNLPQRDNTVAAINNNVQILVQGFNELDQNFKQKEQLLVQKEKEFKAFKASVDNNSKVARDIISESKGNLDQAVSLHKSGQFSEALKYSDIALYNIGDINSFGVKTVEQANKLYLERKQQHIDSAVKRDNLYNSSVVSSGNKSANAFAWVKDNPTRDFYTFFREALNIPDKEQKSPDNVRIIKKLYELLPLYVEEAQRANYFYNEYNKYHDALLKLQQVVNIHNIRAASSKGLKDYEEALKSCEIALEIDPTSATLVNLKNAVLKEKQVVEAKKIEEEKLLVSQTQEIEKLKELLAHKEVETKEQNKLWTQKGNELASTEKVLIDKHQKETEALKALLAQKELEHQELLARKELEKQELLIQKEKEKKELLALKEKQAKELENTKKLQEENIKKEQLLSNQNKVLSDKEQRIEELKALIEQSKIEKEELLAKQELAVANKSYIKNQIINELREEVNLKENEVVDLRIQNLEKELIAEQKEKLLIQKETEIQEKSFAKNQVIGELQEDVDLKEKEAYKLQIELLMKQVEFHKKESEFKEKALLDAIEIVKQKDIVNELQGKLLELKALYGNDVSFSEEFSAIQFRAENSIENRDFGDIQDLARHIDGLVEAGRENSEPMSLATLMALNESPIIHGEEQPIYRSIYIEDRSVQPGSSLLEGQIESLNISSIDRQNQVVQTGGSLIAGEQMPALLNQGNIMNQGVQNQNLIGNFDNQHITHSVVLGGEGSESYEIIQQESFH